MPNYILNKVHFYGKESLLEELKKLVVTEDNMFDFNSIIPMPEELNISHGSDDAFAIRCAKAYNIHGLTTTEEYENAPYWQKEKMSFMEWVNKGNQYLSNLEKYGASTWYDWCINNWGTKWNACEAYWEGNKFASFETAWDTCEPVFEKLSELFPDIEFYVEFADEDLGNNCGTIDYSDGQFTANYDGDFEFACNVWGYDPDEIREEYGEEEDEVQSYNL